MRQFTSTPAICAHLQKYLVCLKSIERAWSASFALHIIPVASLPTTASFPQIVIPVGLPATKHREETPYFGLDIRTCEYDLASSCRESKGGLVSGGLSTAEDEWQ